MSQKKIELKVENTGPYGKQGTPVVPRSTKKGFLNNHIKQEMREFDEERATASLPATSLTPSGK